MFLCNENVKFGVQQFQQCHIRYILVTSDWKCLYVLIYTEPVDRSSVMARLSVPVSVHVNTQHILTVQMTSLLYSTSVPSCCNCMQLLTYLLNVLQSAWSIMTMSIAGAVSRRCTGGHSNDCVYNDCVYSWCCV